MILYARLKNGTSNRNTWGWRGRDAPTGFPLSKSKSFHQVFITLEYVNMLVGIIFQPISISSQIPRGTPKLWPFNCPKLGFPLSKSTSFCPVFIKLGEYVSGHNISTKLYNQQNLACTPALLPLNCPKLGLTLSQRVFIRSLYKTWWICWWA